MVLGTGLKGQDFYDKPDGELWHLTNGLDSVGSRRPPTAPAEAGVASAVAAHLANQALRCGGVADWTTMTRSHSRLRTAAGPDG